MSVLFDTLTDSFSDERRKLVDNAPGQSTPWSSAPILLIATLVPSLPSSWSVISGFMSIVVGKETLSRDCNTE